MKVSSPPRFQRAFHRFLWPVLLMTTWLWLAGMGQVLGAEPVPGAGAAFDQESYADQYQAAKDFFHRLEHDSTFGRERGHWLQGARNFRKIHLSQKRSALGPPSLFMLGKLYRQMYANTGITTDSGRVARSARWARWIARPCRRLFSAAPMPELQVPA